MVKYIIGYESSARYLGGGFWTDVFNFQPENWGNDPV